MHDILTRFSQDTRGEKDLIAYTLLMAFVALASASIFMGAAVRSSSL